MPQHFGVIFGRVQKEPTLQRQLEVSIIDMAALGKNAKTRLGPMSGGDMPLLAVKGHTYYLFKIDAGGYHTLQLTPTLFNKTEYFLPVAGFFCNVCIVLGEETVARIKRTVCGSARPTTITSLLDPQSIQRVLQCGYSMEAYRTAFGLDPMMPIQFPIIQSIVLPTSLPKVGKVVGRDVASIEAAASKMAAADAVLIDDTDWEALLDSL